jgi:hypothetical protein
MSLINFYPVDEKLQIRYLMAKDDNDDILSVLRIIFRRIHQVISSAELHFLPDRILIITKTKSIFSEIVIKIDNRMLIIEYESELMGDLFNPLRQADEEIMTKLVSIFTDFGFGKVDEKILINKNLIKKIYFYCLSFVSK